MWCVFIGLCCTVPPFDGRDALNRHFHDPCGRGLDACVPARILGAPQEGLPSWRDGVGRMKLMDP